MGFGSGKVSKIEYARQLAGTLGYLAVQQGDAVGLSCVADGIVAAVPPRRNPAHLSAVFDVLGQTGAEGETKLVPMLHEIAESNRQRALVIVISDFFVDSADLRECFEHLRFRKHDVAVFQLLDPVELKFDFQRPTRFLDMEGGVSVFSDPTEIADRYHRALDNFLSAFKQLMLESAVDYHQVAISEDYERVLMRFLTGRHQGRGRR